MGTTRRQFLSRGARLGATAVALGVASVAAYVRTGGYHVAPARLGRLRALAPWQLVVVDAVVARLCAPDVPPDAPGAPPSPAEVAAAEFIDGFLAEAAPPMRRDCLRLITLVEHVYPLSCGEAHRFTELAPAAQDRVLEALERSSVDLLRSGFSALKTLAMMAYYRDPRTWGVLGYDGPLVRRPAEGWTPSRHVPPGHLQKARSP